MVRYLRFFFAVLAWVFLAGRRPVLPWTPQARRIAPIASARRVAGPAGALVAGRPRRRLAGVGVLSIALLTAWLGAAAFGVRVFPETNARETVREADFSVIVESVGSAVVLLSTSTCPWCEKTRAWLRENGIAYRDCVVDVDAHAARMLARSGVDTVPQLITADRAVGAYDPEAFAQVLQDAPSLATPATAQRCALPGSAVATRADDRGDPFGG